MHEFAAGQDTQKSWPVGITGFGLGVTDEPRDEALTETEALAGTPAAPARTTATSRTDIFAAIRLTLPSRGRRSPRVGQPEDTVPARPAASASGAATAAVVSRISWSLQCVSHSSRDPRAMLGGPKVDSGRCLFQEGKAGAEPGRVHEPFAGDAEPVGRLEDARPRRALEQAQNQVIGGEEQRAEVGDPVAARAQACGGGAFGDLLEVGLGDAWPVAFGRV